MRRVAVVSTSISTVGYAEPSRILEVEFCNGGVYQYLNVPPDEHAALMVSASKGLHVNREIKTRFSFLRVDGGQ